METANFGSLCFLAFDREGRSLKAMSASPQDHYVQARYLEGFLDPPNDKLLVLWPPAVLPPIPQFPISLLANAISIGYV
ncbi:hypothetical protein [Granulicella sp. dw_53]|uniref:hypothetical protein n=1 Tax=Granulicella sp. dw_53 TaxID=2719792 RepID=UPI001BD6C33F|nr:hypothetical protein [Granulicella sp. dw_53]